MPRPAKRPAVVRAKREHQGRHDESQEDRSRSSSVPTGAGPPSVDRGDGGRTGRRRSRDPPAEEALLRPHGTEPTNGGLLCASTLRIPDPSRNSETVRNGWNAVFGQWGPRVLTSTSRTGGLAATIGEVIRRSGGKRLPVNPVAALFGCESTSLGTRTMSAPPHADCRHTRL